MDRNPRLKPGEYRHKPGSFVPEGPGGRPIAVKVRRRFPYLGLVFMGCAILGPLVAAGLSLLFHHTVLRRVVPTRYSDLPLPPSPSMENILFGAGLHELVLASAVTGLWVWSALWKMRLPPEQQKAGLKGVLKPLMTQGMVLGPLFALVGTLPIAAMGLFLRTGPGNIPWAVKPLFGLVAMLPVSISALFTGIVPLVLILVGIAHGALTAYAVALGWQRFPEEPDTR